MNPQPAPEVGMFVATLVVIMVAYYALVAHAKAIRENISINYDLFEIGQLEESSNQVVVIQKPIKLKKKDKVKDFESKQLYMDCIDTLVAIGYKKSEAKKRARVIFIKHNPKNIQDFLNLLMKKS